LSFREELAQPFLNTGRHRFTTWIAKLCEPLHYSVKLCVTLIFHRVTQSLHRVAQRKKS